MHTYQPLIHPGAAPAALNSFASWYDIVVRSGSAAALAPDGACWINVRDLVEAHIRAVQRVEAGGERIIISPGQSCMVLPRLNSGATRRLSQTNAKLSQALLMAYGCAWLG